MVHLGLTVLIYISTLTLLSRIPWQVVVGIFLTVPLAIWVYIKFKQSPSYSFLIDECGDDLGCLGMDNILRANNHDTPPMGMWIILILIIKFFWLERVYIGLKAIKQIIIKEHLPNRVRWVEFDQRVCRLLKARK